MPFALDWIVPSARGEAAPLSVAATPEAATRVARAGALRGDEALTVTTPLPARSELQVVVRDGPAWNGYIGLQLDASYASTRPLPAGLAGWLALVERIPAGSGARRSSGAWCAPSSARSRSPRLASERAVQHLRAVRVPREREAGAAVGRRLAGDTGRPRARRRRAPRPGLRRRSGALRNGASQAA